MMSYQTRKRNWIFVPNAKTTLTAILMLCLFFSAVPVKGDWKSDANTRIEQIRKRNAQISLVDSNDDSVSGINVQINQVGHRFAFGTCLANSQLSSSSNYRNFALDHFEWAVCENETKWAANEDPRDDEDYTNADYIYTWCNNNGIIMRGHTLFWEQLTYVQQWVKDLPYATYPTSSELLDEVDERINSAVNHFDGKFVHWDVDNEMLPSGSDYRFYDRLGDGGRVHMFQLAHSVAPDCKLFMNEYSGNSFGSYDGWTYRDRANELIGMGAPVNGLGIQGHINYNFDPELYYDNVLEPLSEVGLPIWVTEFDIPQADENLRADDLEEFYRICFSHSSVEGILMWGFFGDTAWRWEGLVDSDWTINAAGIRYEDLLDEWTTNDNDITDTYGNADFRGFHGTYEITLSALGQTPETHTIELEPGTTTAQFVLLTDLESPGPDTTPPANPTGLNATGANGHVSLDWNDNSEIDLDGYNVYRSTVSSSGYAKLNGSLVDDSDYTDNTVTNGTTYYYVVTAVDTSENESGYSNEDWATPDVESQTPYPGPGPHPIPGRIEAENYDDDGEGVAYHDSDSTNEGGAYRSDGVDVETCGEGGYNVGWIANGEWLEYSVDVAWTGTYDIELRVASDSGGGSLHIEFDDTDKTGMLSFPVTGGWQTYTSIFANDVSLTAGPHIMRIAMTADYWNINWVEFTSTGYQTCAEVQAAGYGLASDFDNDCDVDYYDFDTIAYYWLDTDCASNNDCDGADFEPTDGTVDFLDYGDFAGQWQQCNRPNDPNCTPNW